MSGLYQKHRPSKLSEVKGQKEVIKSITKRLETDSLPHAILFTGPSGVGKTTLARILARELKCDESLDLHEINAAAADERGIGKVREIADSVHYPPINGTSKIFILDEAHMLTRRKSGDAQTALLKVMEDTPEHAYFFLCSTDPKDLRKTIRTRCVNYSLSPLSEADLAELVLSVAQKERQSVSEAVASRIASVAEGSARTALVALEQVLGLEEDAQLDAILKLDTEKQAIDLARALMDYKGKPSWGKVAAVLRDLTDDVEVVRRTVLSYTRKVALSQKQPSSRCYEILLAFDEPFQSGESSLTRCCLEICGEN